MKIIVTLDHQSRVGDPNQTREHKNASVLTIDGADDPSHTAQDGRRLLAGATGARN